MKKFSIKRIGAIITAVLLLGFGVAYAYTWSTDAVTGGDFSESIDVVTQSSTQQDVSFINASVDLYYAEQLSGSWTLYPIEGGTLPDGDSPSRFYGTGITIDTGDVPVIAFTSTTNSDLYIARNDLTLGTAGDTAGWTYSMLYDTGTSHRPSVGKDSGGVIGVGFENSGKVMYAYEQTGGSTCALANWTCETIDDGASLQGPQLIFNGTTPILVYTDLSNVQVAVRDGGGSGNCTYSTSWNCYVIDPAAGNSGGGIGAAFNGSSQMIISYVDDDGSALKYAVNDGGTGGGCTLGTWSCSTVSSSTNYGYPIDLDFYSSGNMPILIAQDDTGGEVEFFYNSGSWANDTIGSFGFNDYAALDIVSSYVGIAWYSNTSGGILSYADVTLNSAPTVSTAPVFSSQASDGTGYVTFTTTVDDADDNNLKVKVEYSDDNGSTWYDPDLVSVTASTGTPDLDDSNTYQIGTSTPVSTASGANTLRIVWDTLSVSNGNGSLDGTNQSDIKIRITPNDSTVDGTATASVAFSVDDLDPTAPGSFAAGTVATTSIPLTWTIVTETNFDHYEIWYGANQSDVQGRTGTAVEWDNSDDVNMATVSTTGTTITGLSVNVSYYFKIWAIDDYGNVAAASDILSCTAAVAPSSAAVALSGTTNVAVSWSASGNPAGTYYYVARSDGTNSGWTTSTSWTDVNPTCGQTFSYTVKARNLNATPVETSAASAGSTSVGCGGSPLLSISSSGRSERTNNTSREEVSEEAETEAEVEAETRTEIETEVETETRTETETEVEAEATSERETVERPRYTLSAPSEAVSTTRETTITTTESSSDTSTSREVSTEVREAFRELIGTFEETAEESPVSSEITTRLSDITSDNGDADGDGVSNAEEVRSGTNPSGADSDGDGISDGAEVSMGSNPNDSNSVPTALVGMDGSRDSDSDGVSDMVEVLVGTDPASVSEIARDVFFGGARAESAGDKPVVTAGSFKEFATISEGGGVFSGKYKPNENVTVKVKGANGDVIAEVAARTDDNGRFVTSLGSLLDKGVSKGDTLLLTVEADGKSGEPVVIKIGDSVNAPEIKSEGGSAAILDVNVEELGENYNAFVSWDRVFSEKLLPLYIKGSKYADDFVTALQEIRERGDGNTLFVGKTEPKSRVVFMFESLVTTSVVISDVEGNFSLPVPSDMEEGTHKYTGFLMNMKNNSVSVPASGMFEFVNFRARIDRILAQFKSTL